MKTITISRTFHYENKINDVKKWHVLYFASEEDMLTLAEMVLSGGDWNTTSGKWQMIVNGKKTSIYYTSVIRQAWMYPVRDYKLLWESARDIAKKKLGTWAWLFANDFVRRASTLRYIETAKEEARLFITRKHLTN